MPEQDMQRLQQEAIRRVREMQSRAQMAAHPPQPHPPADPPGGQEHPPSPPPNSSQPGRQGNGGQNGQGGQPPSRAGAMQPQQAGGPSQPAGLPDLFQRLFQDEDRTLILILILLLMEEKTDPSLLFALMYLVL